MGAMDFKRLFLLVLMPTGMGIAAVPTISNFTCDTSDHTSIRCTFDVSPVASYVQIFEGSSTGASDIYATESGEADGFNHTGHAAISWTASTPLATIHICPLARPNADNDTDITSCATYEQTFTMGADVTHPVVPVAPTIYEGEWPDTSSGYTAVTFNSSCVTTATVGPITYGMTTWTVMSGSSIQTAINNEGYGVLNGLPAACNADVSGIGVGNSGLVFKAKAVDPNASGIDDPAHRFILFETIDTTGTDFPPDGVRIDPSSAPNMSTLTASTPVTLPSQLGQCATVDRDSAPTHHYGMRRITCAIDQTVTTGSPFGIMLAVSGNGNNPLIKDNPPQYMIFDQMYLHGNSTVGTGTGMDLEADHVRFCNSYIDGIGKMPQTQFFVPVGIFMEDFGVGHYNICNNYVNYFGFGLYAESNGTLSGSDKPVASDTIVKRNTFYQGEVTDCVLGGLGGAPYIRQPIEFKRGYRILVQGNRLDGSYACANEGPAILVSANPDGDTTPYSGVGNFNARSNYITRAATIFDCMGVRPTNNNPTPNNAVNRTVTFENNWAKPPLGYHDFVAPLGAGGLENAHIWHGPGCADFVVKNNTFGAINPAVAGKDIYPGIEFGNVAGGATLAEGHYVYNNIAYLNRGIAEDRIFGQTIQLLPSHPAAPTPNTTGTPLQYLNTFSVRLSAGNTVTPFNSWDHNTIIPALINPGGGPATWNEMNTAQAAASATGMPTGDTYAVGNTVALREANVGFNPITGRCSGCSGNGANIDTLYSEMGVVTGVVAPTPTTTTLAFSYTAPDSAGCSIDVSTNSTFATIFSRTSDGGGSTSRTPSVTGLTPSTLYYWRILCVFPQINGSYGETSENWPAGQITEGSTTTVSATGGSLSIGSGVRIGAGVTF